MSPYLLAFRSAVELVSNTALVLDAIPSWLRPSSTLGPVWAIRLLRHPLHLTVSGFRLLGTYYSKLLKIVTALLVTVLQYYTIRYYLSSLLLLFSTTWWKLLWALALCSLPVK